jgi:hypothetical protein
LLKTIHEGAHRSIGCVALIASRFVDQLCVSRQRGCDIPPVPHLLVDVVDVMTEVGSQPRLRIPQDESNRYRGFDGDARYQLCGSPRRRGERRKGALDVLRAPSEKLSGHSDNGIGRKNIRTQGRKPRIDRIVATQCVVDAEALSFWKRVQYH